MHAEAAPRATPQLEVDATFVRGSQTFRVRFEASSGVTVLFGPSGAGKSSTLALVAGLLAPASGVVHFHRSAGDVETWADPARGVAVPPEARKVALVFQGLALFPHLTAEANVAYALPRSLPSRARRDEARASLARFQVGHLEGRLPGTFSGGEARRVALARGLAMKPRVLLLDEPFTGIDAALRMALTFELRRAIEEAPMPVVYVTHDPGEARSVAERVLLLKDGVIVACGGPELVPG